MVLFVEIAGWVGSGLILLAYLLVSTERVSSRSLAFHAINLAGAAGLGVNALYHGAIPPTALEVAWAAIAGYGVWKAVRG